MRRRSLWEETKVEVDGVGEKGGEARQVTLSYRGRCHGAGPCPSLAR